MVTAFEIKLVDWQLRGRTVTIPAGTQVHTVKDGTGADAWYAEPSPSMVEPWDRLFMEHDAKYHYLYLPKDTVTI